MKKTLFFINSSEIVEYIILNKLQNTDNKIFSFNIDSHKFLESKNIKHEIAEKFLTKLDREKIFDYSLNFSKWYEKNINFEKMRLEKINILEILDSTEFHNLMVNEIFYFYLIKKIIDIEKPDKIYCSQYFYKIIQLFSLNIELELIDQGTHRNLFTWNNYMYEINFLKRNFSFSITRKNYLRFKNFLEFLIIRFFGLNFDLKNKKSTIIFLEFDPKKYCNLIENLSKQNKRVVLFNNRRSPVWNLKSIKLLKKCDCSIITRNILQKKDKLLIKKFFKNYFNNLEECFKCEEVFSEIFSIEGYSFSSLIKEPLYEIFKERLEYYIELAYISSIISTHSNNDYVISLNQVGETEKTLLSFIQEKTTSIMLQHAFTNYVDDIVRYDVFDSSIFRDKIALWGPTQMEYLRIFRNISKNRMILTGSPRHDIFFKQSKSKNSTKLVIITTQNMEPTWALTDTRIYLRIVKILKNIIKILKNFPEFQLIIKLHPAKDPGNEFLKQMIIDLDSNIMFEQKKSFLELANSSHTIININSELYPSTTMLEGMILNKPILDIVATDTSYPFDFRNTNSILSVNHETDFEPYIKKILSDNSFRDNLLKKQNQYVEKYLVNRGSASIEFAKLLGGKDF